MPNKYSTAQRILAFWMKVDKSPHPKDCWLWTGGKYGKGYGMFWWNEQTIGAHRVSYELAYGKFLEKLNVLHHCDNPSCVNPKHLFLGDHQANMDDKTAKGRGNPPIGERSGSSKLTKEQVLEIRYRCATTRITYKELGEEFGVSLETIRSAVKKRHWKYID